MTAVFSLHLGSRGIPACRARIKTPARPFGESRTLACVGAERPWATAALPCRRCSAYREVRRSAGGGGGFPPPGFLGTLSHRKSSPGGPGAARPRLRQAGRRPARQKGGVAAHPRPRQRTTGSRPPACAFAKRLEGAERPRKGGVGESPHINRQAGRRPARQRRRSRLSPSAGHGAQKPLNLVGGNGAAAERPHGKGHQGHGVVVGGTRLE